MLSSLRHASEAPGRHLPAEIGCLSWISFFVNAVLVVLQLVKPDDTVSAYVRMVGREGVVPSTAADNRGWQAFWAGGGDTVEVPSVANGNSGSTSRRASSSWCCFGGRRRRRRNSLGGDGAWPIASDGGGSLDESLLGSIDFDERTGLGGASPFKAKKKKKRKKRAGGGGFFKQVGGFLSSAVKRGTTKATAAAEQEEGRVGVGQEERGWLQRQGNPFGQGSNPFGRNPAEGGTTARKTRAQQALGGGPSSSYPSAASIGARAPPQVAAPVFGVAVTRWRLVDADGVPSVLGSSGDVVWADRSTERSRSRASWIASTRTSALSGSESASTVAEGGEGGRFSGDLSDASLSASAATAGLNPFDDGGASTSVSASASPPDCSAPLTVEFELLVRASGRGEMDWWGRGDPEPAGGTTFAGAAAAAATAITTATAATTAADGRSSAFAVGGSAAATPGAGDWRVWRSAADTLALYDALALRFGQEFGRRVSRPNFLTYEKHVTLSSSVGDGSDDGSGTGSPPLLAPLPSALHRVDIQRDTKTIGAFLRSLMGLRQFLRCDDDASAGIFCLCLRCCSPNIYQIMILLSETNNALQAHRLAPKA